MKNLITLLIAIIAPLMSTIAQDIDQISKSDPLVISGAIGTNNTFYHSSNGMGYRSPFNNSIYANLNISIYGMNMPFAFYYVNNNTQFTYPQFSFGFSPSYRNWTVHIGRRWMNFSNYVYNLPFTGGGVEYRGRWVEFGAFYGTLNQAINDDPLADIVRTPQYRRTGMGIKAAIKYKDNSLAVMVFKGKDNLSSIREYWQDKIDPMENLAIGISGRFSLFKMISLSGNLYTSALTSDIRSSIITEEDLATYDKIYTTRHT